MKEPVRIRQLLSYAIHMKRIQYQFVLIENGGTDSLWIGWGTDWSKITTSCCRGENNEDDWSHCEYVYLLLMNCVLNMVKESSPYTCHNLRSVCIILIYSLLPLLAEFYYLKEYTDKKFLLFFSHTLPKIVWKKSSTLCHTISQTCLF